LRHADRAGPVPELSPRVRAPLRAVPEPVRRHRGVLLAVPRARSPRAAERPGPRVAPRPRERLPDPVARLLVPPAPRKGARPRARVDRERARAGRPDEARARLSRRGVHARRPPPPAGGEFSTPRRGAGASARAVGLSVAALIPNPGTGFPSRPRRDRGLLED